MEFSSIWYPQVLMIINCLTFTNNKVERPRRTIARKFDGFANPHRKVCEIVTRSIYDRIMTVDPRSPMSPSITTGVVAGPSWWYDHYVHEIARRVISIGNRQEV